MSLITKILEPDQFNAETIAELFSSALQIPAIIHNAESIARYVLNSLESHGIVNRTEILKPANFNSTTIAILMWEQANGPNAWTQGTEAAHMVTIDQSQYVLDALWRRGIIG